MTKDQIHALEMAVYLAQYFVEEHQDDEFCDRKGEQWRTDNARVILARQILQEFKDKL